MAFGQTWAAPGLTDIPPPWLVVGCIHNHTGKLSPAVGFGQTVHPVRLWSPSAVGPTVTPQICNLLLQQLVCKNFCCCPLSPWWWGHSHWESWEQCLAGVQVGLQWWGALSDRSKLPPDLLLAPLIPISIYFLKPVPPQSLIHLSLALAVPKMSCDGYCSPSNSHNHPMAGFTPSQNSAWHGKAQHSRERISLWIHLSGFSFRNSSPVLFILASSEWPIQGAVSSEPHLSLCSDWPFIITEQRPFLNLLNWFDFF